jgi:hypothetical protein
MVCDPGRSGDMMRNAVEAEDDCSSVQFVESDSDGGEQNPSAAKQGLKGGSRHFKKDSLGLDIFFSRIDVNQMPSIHNPDVMKESVDRIVGEEDAQHDREWERWAKRRFVEAARPESIVLDEEGTVLAATLFKLVMLVTLGTDKQLTEDFFMTYRMFAEPEEMARLMALRLRMVFEVESEAAQRDRVKCFLALRHWIQNYFELDFAKGKAKAILHRALNRIWEETLILSMADKQMLMSLEKFLNAANETDEPEAVKEEASDQLSQLNIQLHPKPRKGSWMSKLFRRTPKETPAFLRVASPSFSSLDEDKASVQSSVATERSPESFDCFLLERSEDLASQLCLIEADVFSSISWSDMLLCSSKPESIKRAVDHFNRMVCWLVEQLTVEDQTLINLVAKLERMIKVGHKCTKYGNFASAVQIALALQNGEVQGMAEAWGRISTGSRAMLKDLLAFACPLKNWRTVRRAMEALEDDEEPCVPFLGLYMSDVNAINEIPSSYSGGDLVPWFRCAKLARIVRQFRALQRGTVDPRRAYEFKRRPELFAYLTRVIGK